MLTANMIELLKGKYIHLGPLEFATSVHAAVKAATNGRVRGTIRPLESGFQALFDSMIKDIGSGKKPPDEETFHRLACMINDVGVPIDWTTVLHPWGNLPAGGKVVVLVADKRVGEGPLARRMLDKCDVESVDTVRMIRDRLRLKYDVDRQIVSGNLSRKETEKQLDKLCENPDVHLIVSTSSDLRNPFSAVIADRITRGNPLPIRLRWSIRPPRTSSLSFSDPGDTKMVGVASKERMLVRRHVDDEIVGSQNSTITDCGLLLIDLQSEPALVVAAGHGGNGTHGCIEAMFRERHVISEHLSYSKRGLAAVQATLVKETNDFGDDLYIDKVKIVKWENLTD